MYTDCFKIIKSIKYYSPRNSYLFYVFYKWNLSGLPIVKKQTVLMHQNTFDFENHS